MKMFVYQGNDHDCGFASLKILLALINNNKSFLYIPKREKKGNYSLSDLIEIGKDYGVELEAFKCDDTYLNQIKSPVITIINYNHTVVIKKITKRNVVYLDPAEGKIKIKRTKFMKIWQRTLIEVIKNNSDNALELNKTEIIPKKLRILNSLFSVTSTAIIIGCFYLLNDVSNALFSLVFVGLFATTQLIENILLFKQIYHFDKTFINAYFSRDENQDKISYLEFEGFKQEYFTKNRSLLSAIIIAFLVAFLLILNDIRNGFVLLALVLINLLDIVLFSKSEKDEQNKINHHEICYFEDPINSLHHVRSANFLANKLVFKNKTKRVIMIILAFAFAMVMMVVTGNSGCNYVIFHFGLYYIGSDACSNVISGLSNYKELEKSEAKFLDRCNL